MLASLLSGCAGTGGGETRAATEVTIGGVTIFNQGQGWVSAARVLVPATGQFVSCGNIAPGAACATGFPEQHFSGNPVEITWSEGGAIHSTGELRLDLPLEAVESGAARVQVWLLGPGQAAAEVVAVPLPQ